MLILALITPSVSFAEDAIPVEETLAKAYVLMERTGGQILLEKDSDTGYSVAGLTRLCAMLLICEALDRGEMKGEDPVIISESAAAVPGPTAFLETGETVSAESLLKCAVMISAGDAIMALAEALCGTEQAFLQKMHVRLSDLGIDVEYDSLANTRATLSAKELAVIGAKLAGSESYMRYSSIYLDELIHDDGRRTELVNPNKLVKENIGCLGLSTGSSTEAGYCGVFAFSRSEQDVICVVLGAKKSQERFKMAVNLVDYGYANFKSCPLAKAGEVMQSGVAVNKGTLKQVDLIAKDELVLMLPKDAGDPIPTMHIPESLEAPFAAGETLGRIEYTDKSGHLLATLELAAAESAELAGYGEYLLDLFYKWLRN